MKLPWITMTTRVLIPQLSIPHYVLRFGENCIKMKELLVPVTVS